MIGRPAVCDPFLIGRIKNGITERNPLEVLIDFQDELYKTYSEMLCGPGHLLDKMKELWRYFGQSFPDNPKELRNLELSKTLADYQNALENMKRHGKWKGLSPAFS
jgi:tRNA-dihydrouridine synthase